MLTIYGIRQCDTVRKALKWLEERGIDHQFHDYRKQGLDPAKLEGWMNRFGWEAIINRRGTTWRRLPEPVRAAMSQTAAIGAACDNPSLIRRPIAENGDTVLLGFDEDAWTEALT